MSEGFPTVGLIGEPSLQRMTRAPAIALGVELVNLEKEIDPELLATCNVASVIGDSLSASQVKMHEISGQSFRPNSSSMAYAKEWNEAQTLREPSDAVFSVLVARSPHGQASSWAPTEILHEGPATITITPAPALSRGEAGMAQSLALDLAKRSGAVGVVDVEMVLAHGELSARRISLGPSQNGSWSIEGARTSQFEQHLRAILDLPLGDPSQLAPFVVTGTYFGEGNMYRPYLHLMARSPALKIHQYLTGALQAKGHVTAMGSDLLDLRECVTHAVEYMSGVIDE